VVLGHGVELSPDRAEVAAGPDVEGRQQAFAQGLSRSWSNARVTAAAKRSRFDANRKYRPGREMRAAVATSSIDVLR